MGGALAAFSAITLSTTVFRQWVTPRITGLFATVGVQAGARRVSFACRGLTTTRRSRTSPQRMAWHVSHIRRPRPLEENVEFSSIHPTQQVSLRAMKPLLYENHTARPL